MEGADTVKLLDRLTHVFNLDFPATHYRDKYEKTLHEESVIPFTVIDNDGKTIIKHVCIGEYESDPDKGITHLVMCTTTPEGEFYQDYVPSGEPRRES